mgnify:CR=1 FL=1
MKKRLFISQPMADRPNEKIEKERNEIVAEVIEKFPQYDIEVIDSFFKDAPVEANGLWYLGKSIQLLSTADIAYFADGWGKARGCRIENRCAIDYGIEIVIENYTGSKMTKEIVKKENVEEVDNG